MNVMMLPEIMDGSLDLLRKYIKSIVLFSIIYMILAFIMLIPLFIAIVIIMALTDLTGTAGTVSVVLILVVTLLAIPVALGFSLSYRIGLIKIVSQDMLGEKILAYDAIKASFKSFFKALGIGAAGTVFSLPLLAVLGGAGYLVFSRWDPFANRYDPFFGIPDLGGSAVLLAALFLIVILVLALIVSAYLNFFCFSLQALILEKQSVPGSVKRSFSMVKSAFGRIFGCAVLFYLTVYMITLSIQSFGLLISGLIYLALQFLNIPPDAVTFVTLAYNYSSYPVSILSWLVISPLRVIMTTLLYYNRRFIREGWDIRLKLDEIKRSALEGQNENPFLKESATGGTGDEYRFEN